MTQNETKYMESAIALAEELNFTKAAKRIGIPQPQLTRNIKSVEWILGGPLFVRNSKAVLINDAGRAYVEQSRLSIMYRDRAMEAARSVMHGADLILHVGRSPFADPLLTTVLLSVHLPLFPKIGIALKSQFSCKLTRDVLARTLDLAILIEPPEDPQLSTVKIAESQFYIAVSQNDPIAHQVSTTLEMLAKRLWVMFDRRLHPPLYDSVMRLAEQRNISPSKVQHVMMPEEVFPFVADGNAVAFLAKPGAMLLAQNGITVRPLAEEALPLRTYFASHFEVYSCREDS